MKSNLYNWRYFYNSTSFVYAFITDTDRKKKQNVFCKCCIYLATDYAIILSEWYYNLQTLTTQLWFIGHHVRRSETSKSCEDAKREEDSRGARTTPGGERQENNVRQGQTTQVRWWMTLWQICTRPGDSIALCSIRKTRFCRWNNGYPRRSDGETGYKFVCFSAPTIKSARITWYWDGHTMVKCWIWLSLALRSISFWSILRTQRFLLELNHVWYLTVICLKNMMIGE